MYHYYAVTAPKEDHSNEIDRSLFFNAQSTATVISGRLQMRSKRSREWRRLTNDGDGDLLGDGADAVDGGDVHGVVPRLVVRVHCMRIPCQLAVLLALLQHQVITHWSWIQNPVQLSLVTIIQLSVCVAVG